jgi:hypothetical protein
VARRTSYGFQKQQRDLKTQKKREEKDEKKRRKQESAAEGEVAPPTDTEHEKT